MTPATFLTANVVNTTDGQPLEKKGTTSSDYPNFLLELVRIAGPITSTSSADKWVITFQVGVNTGEPSASNVHRYMSLLMKAISGLNKKTGIFQYKNDYPLKRLIFSNSDLGLSVDKSRRNVDGYSYLARFEAELYVNPDKVAD